MFDADFSGLVIFGNPSSEELQAAWNIIFTEYCGLMHSKSYNEIFEIIKDINILQAKIALVDNACVILEIYPEQSEVIRILKEIGLNTSNISQLKTRAKKFNVTLQQKYQEYERLMKNQPEVSRETYYDDLNALSHAEGYMIRETEIMVSRFCKLLNHHRERVERESMKHHLKIA